MVRRGFWAPFREQVTKGLRDLPLVAVEESEELLALSRCRKPDSVLMSRLGW